MRRDAAVIVTAVVASLVFGSFPRILPAQITAPTRQGTGTVHATKGASQPTQPVYGPEPETPRTARTAGGASPGSATPRTTSGTPASGTPAGGARVGGAAATGTPGSGAPGSGTAGGTPARTTASPQGKAPAGPAGVTQPVFRPATPGLVAAPQAPSWFPLPPEHEKYLDQVLQYWQDSSSKIKRYRCKFTRWEYDGTFMSRDVKTGEMPAKTQSTGVIKYAAPDKGLFKVEQLLYYTPPQKAGERAQYLARPEDRGEQWICDGKSVFAFDHQQKQLMQTELPPEMQGRAIVDGPLPFMFGADAAKIKQRFWIRVITPKDSKGEYWLEAVPKTRTDAANFKMLHIIIDEADFLPKAMALFGPNYDPRTNPTCTNFVFEKREVNWNDTIDKINIFAREFWEPATPLGYKKVVERYQPTPEERTAAPGTVAPGPATKQATRPGPVRPNR